MELDSSDIKACDSSLTISCLSSFNNLLHQGTEELNYDNKFPCNLCNKFSKKLDYSYLLAGK